MKTWQEAIENIRNSLDHKDSLLWRAHSFLLANEWEIDLSLLVEIQNELGIHEHDSGALTFEKDGVPFFMCPLCQTKHKWPFNAANDAQKALCDGGCCNEFELDK